jgi:hypothetical protein
MEKACGCVAETGDIETVVTHRCFCEKEYRVPEGWLQIQYGVKKSSIQNVPCS